jgi:hypothetical protein
MENKDFFKNKAVSNAVTTHSDMKRNITKGDTLAITLLYSTHTVNIQAEQS